MTPRYLAPAGGALALFWSLQASAEARFPQPNAIIFSPTDPTLVVARASYGILPSHDDGTTWDYVCQDALGLPFNAFVDPPLGLTANNALIGALVMFPGLSVSPDTGCSWNCAAGAPATEQFVDLSVRPDDPHSVVALASTATADGGAEVFSTQVFQSTDDGATWGALGVPIADPLFAAVTIGVAKTDPRRIYVSGSDSSSPNRTATVWTSRDSGNTWAATQFPAALFDPTQEDSLFIGGVDPTNADRVYVRSKALAEGGLSRLFMSTDGAATFTQLTFFQVTAPQNTSEIGEVASFALSPDGSKIYVGTRESGLLVATRADAPSGIVFHQTSPIRIDCLATRGDELWVCSDAGSTFTHLGGTFANTFVVGMTKDDGATFTPELRSVTCLRSALDCSHATSTTTACNAAVSGAAQCGMSFSSFCSANDSPDEGCNCDEGPPDASARDAQPTSQPGGGTTDGGTTATHKSSSSCGCSVVGEPRIAGASLFVAGLALGRRRRRTQQAPSRRYRT